MTALIDLFEMALRAIAPMDGVVSTVICALPTNPVMRSCLKALRVLATKAVFLSKKNHQMCNVTNRKILDNLNGKIPQVTFSCNATEATCNFQFWVDQRESFFCGLDSCEFDTEYKGSTNITNYHCANAHCKCVPDRMLCGEKGSIDISRLFRHRNHQRTWVIFSAT